MENKKQSTEQAHKEQQENTKKTAKSKSGAAKKANAGSGTKNANDKGKSTQQKAPTQTKTKVVVTKARSKSLPEDGNSSTAGKAVDIDKSRSGSKAKDSKNSQAKDSSQYKTGTQSKGGSQAQAKKNGIRIENDKKSGDKSININITLPGVKKSAQTAQERDITVLNQIYQNAQMGKQAISNVLPKVDSTPFKKELLNQYKSYEDICSKSAAEIMKLGEKPKEKNPVSKAVLWGSINISTLMDDSPSNIADMAIKGSHSNINDLTRTLNQYKNISADIKNLAGSAIAKEQSGIDSLMRFL